MTASSGRPLWVYALVVLVAGTSLYLAYELGRYESGYSMLDHRRERAQLTERLAAEKAVSDELRRQLAIGETSSEIDRATYAQVETTLADLQAQIQTQEEELVFTAASCRRKTASRVFASKGSRRCRATAKGVTSCGYCSCKRSSTELASRGPSSCNLKVFRTVKWLRST